MGIFFNKVRSNMIKSWCFGVEISKVASRRYLDVVTDE